MKRNYVVGLWGAAALAAIVAGVLAVSIAQGGLFPEQTQPMSAEEIERELAAAPTPEDSPSDEATGDEPTDESGEPSRGDGELETAPDSAATAANEKLITTDGGSVMARCDAQGDGYLVWWVPEQGFITTDIDRGPDDDVEITFKSSQTEIEVEVECEDGFPVADIDID
ncbi:hypothetical protein [Natronoglycomyces albus]|uniref:Septum formation initiator n=1 Tax=Natronoglycomyces albus TaxID=2811108 RepID=A0A895XRK1_9ACTN|nr:hypothetical protein [Natronoglycomyces albus]QSB05186.1 hypothetical protein JQS30_15740 [Natronoglycomyces albus]